MTSFINIQLTADANFAPVYGELGKLKAAMASLSKQTIGNIVPAGLVQGLQNAEGQMLANVAATKAFNVETVALASSTERLTRQISQSKLKLGEYFSIIGKSRKGIVDELNQIAAAQAKMHAATVIPSSTQKGYAHIIAATSAAGNAAKQAQIYQQLLNTAYKDGAEKLINFGKNTQWAGRQLTAGLTVPLALAGKAASQMFLDVNTEMTRLQKVYGVGLTETTKSQLNAVKNEIMGLATEMSKTLGVSAKETTSMAADLAAAGLTGKDLINATRQASRMVVLGETDKQDAIKATIALQTAFKLNTGELTDSVNFFNAAQAATSTNMADLIGAIPRVGPVVKGLGGSYKDMVALLVAMKEGGVSAGEGANALKNSLARIIAPTQKAKDTLRGYGIDMDSIVNRNAGNLIGTITELQTGLDKLPNLQRQRAISEMFGKYQFSRMTAMFNNFNKEGTQSAKVMQMMGLSSAELAGIAEKQTKQIQESAAGKYKIAMESFKTAILPIGESFLNLATKVLNIGEKIAHVFTKLGPIGTALKAILGGAMIVGPITMIVGLVANLAGQLFKMYNAARMFKQGFGSTQGGLFTRFKGGVSGTQNFFKEADPALLASQRLSETVTRQVMTEKEAIQALTTAIGEYAAEVQRLEQIYAGGPVTPRPGGAPGARGASVGMSGVELRASEKGGRITSVGGTTPEFLHAAGGTVQQASQLLQGNIANAMQVGTFTTAAWEKELNQKYGGAGMMQSYIPPSLFATMTAEQKAGIVRTRAAAAGQDVSGISDAELASHMDPSRILSQTKGMAAFTRISDALGGKVSMKRGETASQYAARLKSLMPEGEFDKIMHDVEQKIKAISDAAEEAVKHLPIEKKADEYSRIVTDGLSQMLVEETNAASKETKKLLLKKAREGSTKGPMRDALDTARKALQSQGVYALGTAPELAMGVVGGVEETVSAGSMLRARIEERAAAAGMSVEEYRQSIKSRMGAAPATPAKISKFRQRLSGVRNVFGGKFGGAAGAAAGFGLQMVSSFIPGSDKPFEEQSAGMQTMGGLSKGLQIGGAIGQFLPPPYNMIATGAGAIIGAVGGLIQGRIAHAQMLARQQAAAIAGSARASSTALEHFGIKINDFSEAAFKASAKITEAEQTEIERLKAAYKAKIESDSAFKDEIEGLKRMDFSSQIRLLSEKFRADMAAGMTAGQARTDISAYAQSAGISGFALMSLNRTLTALGNGATRASAVVDGLANSLTGKTGGSFLFGVVTSAKSAQDFVTAMQGFDSQMKNTKNSIQLTADNFTGYNDEVRKQNGVLAAFNDQLFNQNVTMQNLKQGTSQYSQAIERIIIANRLFADGIIQTQQQMELAAQSAQSLAHYLSAATNEQNIQAEVNAQGSTISAREAAKQQAAQAVTADARAAAAGKAATKYTKQEIQSHIDAQKTVIKNLQTQIEQNNTLRQQAQAAAEANKEVQNAQQSLDEAMASGNLLRISAAQANLEETKTRIANTAQFDRTQSSLQSKVDTAQSSMDKWTTKMEKWTEAANKARTQSSEITADISQGTTTNNEETANSFETLTQYYAQANGDYGKFLSLIGNSPRATAARQALEKNGWHMKDIQTRLENIKRKGGSAWDDLVRQTQKVGDNLERIKDLVDLASQTSAAESIDKLTKGTTAKAVASNQQTFAKAVGALGESATTQNVIGLLKKKFSSVYDASAALGVKPPARGKMTWEYLVGHIPGVGGMITDQGFAQKNYVFQQRDKDGKEVSVTDPTLRSWLDLGWIKSKYNSATKKYVVPTEHHQDSDLPIFTDSGKAALKSGALDKVIITSGMDPLITPANEYWQLSKFEQPTSRNATTTVTRGAINKFNSSGENVGGGYNLFATGGLVRGPGTGTSDSIRARLSDGEYVVNAAAVKKMGIKYLDMINQGMFLTPTFTSINSGGGNVNNVGTMNNTVYNINVNVEGSNASPDDIANAVLKTIERKQQTLYTNRRII